MTRVWQAAMRWSKSSRSPLSATLAMVSAASQQQPTWVSSSVVPAENVFTSRAEFTSYSRTVLSAPACRRTESGVAAAAGRLQRAP